MTNDHDRTRQRLTIAMGALVAVSAIASVGAVTGRALAEESWTQQTTATLPDVTVSISGSTPPAIEPRAGRTASPSPATSRSTAVGPTEREPVADRAPTATREAPTSTPSTADIAERSPEPEATETVAEPTASPSETPAT